MPFVMSGVGPAEDLFGDLQKIDKMGGWITAFVLCNLGELRPTNVGKFWFHNFKLRKDNNNNVNKRFVVSKFDLQKWVFNIK